MMTLGIRKLVVISLVGAVFLLANFIWIASWLQDKGVIEWATGVRQEYLTGTAITIIVALLILLVGGHTTKRTWLRSCPVCDRRQRASAAYCSDCGSKL
jgi:hypothetical protein